MRLTNKKEIGLAHIAIILLVIVVAGLAFGGWWVWQKNTRSSESSSTPQEQNVRPPGGWKFYQNKEAGFSFYFPSEWGEVKKTGVESRRLGAGEVYAFTSGQKITMNVHENEREVSSIEFGNIEPAVVDVFLKDGKPVVELSQGFQPFREFTNDQVLKKLNNDKLCLAEDYQAEDYMGEDPFLDDSSSASSYTYFGYCGLSNQKFGAFTISSGQRDGKSFETQEAKHNITELLKTFEIF